MVWWKILVKSRLDEESCNNLVTGASKALHLYVVLLLNRWDLENGRRCGTYRTAYRGKRFKSSDIAYLSSALIEFYQRNKASMSILKNVWNVFGKQSMVDDTFTASFWNWNWIRFKQAELNYILDSNAGLATKIM